MFVFPVRVYVGLPVKSRRACDLVDQARRQADYLGRPGFEAKRGQTDEQFRRKGHLRFVFRNRQSARCFQRRVRRFCNPLVLTKRMKKRL